MSIQSFAPGKIILSGEYAVVFGYPGIAVPSSIGMQILYEENNSAEELVIVSEGISFPVFWIDFAEEIVRLCEEVSDQKFLGTLTVNNQLPLGKGMGSSTALVVAICRCLLGEDCRSEALSIEQYFNPNQSGIDFTVIWDSKPVLCTKGSDPQPIDLSDNLLDSAVLIDTGTPNEATPVLVASVKEKTDPCHAEHTRSMDALKTIGSCADHLLSGEDLGIVFRDHHRAQVKLGVVPEHVQKLVALIEEAGGAAKVIGAGGRTGGGGMVLAIDANENVLKGWEWMKLS